MLIIIWEWTFESSLLRSHFFLLQTRGFPKQIHPSTTNLIKASVIFGCVGLRKCLTFGARGHWRSSFIGMQHVLKIKQPFRQYGWRLLMSKLSHTELMIPFQVLRKH